MTAPSRRHQYVSRALRDRPGRGHRNRHRRHERGTLLPAVTGPSRRLLSTGGGLPLVPIPRRLEPPPATGTRVVWPWRRGDELSASCDGRGRGRDGGTERRAAFPLGADHERVGHGPPAEPAPAPGRRPLGQRRRERRRPVAAGAPAEQRARPQRRRGGRPTALLALVLLRLARAAAARPIWRSICRRDHPPNSFPSRPVHPFGARASNGRADPLGRKVIAPCVRGRSPRAWCSPGASACRPGGGRRDGSVHPAQANTRTVSSTEVTLTSTLSLAAPSPTLNPKRSSRDGEPGLGVCGSARRHLVRDRGPAGRKRRLAVAVCGQPARHRPRSAGSAPARARLPGHRALAHYTVGAGDTLSVSRPHCA